MSGGACWCGSRESVAVLSLHRTGFDHEFPLVRCKNCGTGRLDPPPTAEELARAYAADYYGATRKKFVGPIANMVAWFQNSRVWMLDRYLEHRAASRILDIGCGNGDFLRRARDAGYSVEGTELSEESARRASPEGDIKVHVGDVSALALPEGSYAAVTLWHVLEHVPEPLETLRAAHRALAPNGWLFISLPNAQSWQASMLKASWFHYDPPRHLWHFDPKSLTALLRAAGYEPVKWSHLSLEQNPYGWLQGMLNAFGFPQERLYELLKGQERWRSEDIWMGIVAASLVVPAVNFALAEASLERGGTIAVVARRIPVP